MLASLPYVLFPIHPSDTETYLNHTHAYTVLMQFKIKQNDVHCIQNTRITISNNEVTHTLRIRHKYTNDVSNVYIEHAFVLYAALAVPLPATLATYPALNTNHVCQAKHAFFFNFLLYSPSNALIYVTSSDAAACFQTFKLFLVPPHSNHHISLKWVMEGNCLH